MIPNLLSCATCAANYQGDGNAAGWSVLFLLAVILPVLAGVIWCMVRIARRESDNLDPELRDDFPAATR